MDALSLMDTLSLLGRGRIAGKNAPTVSEIKKFGGPLLKGAVQGHIKLNAKVKFLNLTALPRNSNEPPIIVQLPIKDKPLSSYISQTELSRFTSSNWHKTKQSLLNHPAVKKQMAEIKANYPGREFNFDIPNNFVLSDSTKMYANASGTSLKCATDIKTQKCQSTISALINKTTYVIPAQKPIEHQEIDGSRLITTCRYTNGPYIANLQPAICSGTGECINYFQDALNGKSKITISSQEFDCKTPSATQIPKIARGKGYPAVCPSATDCVQDTSPLALKAAKDRREKHSGFAATTESMDKISEQARKRIEETKQGKKPSIEDIRSRARDAFDELDRETGSVQ